MNAYRGDANRDRYLAIVNWAAKRYTHQGQLLITIGAKPSTYTRIEDLAAVKYLGCGCRYYT